MSTIYEALGVKTIINAKGTATRLSGGIMAEEVARAMAEATHYCVDIAELQGRASTIIADLTGAEAGYVTSGAAAGLLLGTAACVTGLDPARMNRLPDTRDMPNEVIVVRSQRNFYDHAVRTVGVRLVEVGLPDRYSGAGVRDAEAWEIADAITPRTACVFYVAHPRARPTLVEVVEVAHAAGIPVLVDAAAQLPPAANLKRFIATGADLVAFSGGKVIGGPQGSGILCGRRDLVAAAALQHLDQDILFAQWRPPPALFGELQLRGLPHHGIGRPCKVGKEQIVGLLVALRHFVTADEQQRRAYWRRLLDELAGELDTMAGVASNIIDDHPDAVPRLELRLDEDQCGFSALELLIRLQDGEPAIHVDNEQVDEGIVVFSPLCLRPGEPAIVGHQLVTLLKAGLGADHT